MKARHLIFLTTLSILGNCAVNADVSLYQGGGLHTDTIADARNAFLSATSTSLETFEDSFGAGTNINFPVSPATTEFQAASPLSMEQVPDFNISGSFSLGHSDGSCTISAGNTISFSFISPVTAFGVDVRDVSDGGNILSFQLNIGDSGTATTEPDTLPDDFSHNEFFGLTSTVPFTSITFTSSGPDDCVYWEDLRYEASSASAPTKPIPAMSAWGLGILAGLIGFMGYRGRMRRQPI